MLHGRVDAGEGFMAAYIFFFYNPRFLWLASAGDERQTVSANEGMLSPGTVADYLTDLF